ncbi:hypothetical protein GWI33_015845 [Rhynchophorus ferrugineus]|uniref:Transposase n=1 Tax=Rhynchophorus ferrugineus TaxID=354439 RepID=A0A834HYF1_RHYFE|nr:hypothetical protein GWI33_015845 [Rhynchophorus ferrugineus]
MAFVFWDAHAIIFIAYLEKERAINSDHYIALLDRLKDEIAEKRTHIKKKKVLLHQNNAPCQKSMNWASNYFLIRHLKRMLAGKKFSSNEGVIAETEAYFEANDKSYYNNGIEKLEGRYHQCITLEGNYVE